MSLFDALKCSTNRLAATQAALKTLLRKSGSVSGSRRVRRRKSAQPAAELEVLENRQLLTTIAIVDGDWTDANIWDNGVPTEETRAIIGAGVTVDLDGADHFAKEVVVHGNLVVPEETAAADPMVVADGRMQLFVNGGLVGDAPASQLWAHGNAIGIGGTHGTTKTDLGNIAPGQATFEGRIDKVATHNRALTTTEIDSLYTNSRQSSVGIPQDDIASLWMFPGNDSATLDTAEGDAVNDDGTLVGDARTTGALLLDGDGDYLKVNSSADLNNGVFTEKTVSLWFRAFNTDGVQVIYEQGGATRGLNVYLKGDTLYAGAWNTPDGESGWSGDWISQAGILPNQWNHVVLTLDANQGGEAEVDVDKTLTTNWVHVNSGGEFTVGSEDDRYDTGTFALNLTGSDKYANHVIETATGTMNVMQNDGFLMTAMGGRVQFYGEEKLSFTKLNATAEMGDTSITVANLIERNFDQGATNGDEFVTSAADDGVVNWEVGDQIVIASSSYDYTEEDVRIITAINDNGDGTSTISLDESLDFRHYGEIETYGDDPAEGTAPASQVRAIDLRAEVALLSRNVKVQGLTSQDTDIEFGDRADAQVEDRIRANGLTDAEWAVAPDQQLTNGVGGHLMFMPGSGQIIVDGVQLDGLGQSSQKGRYPIHWHLGKDRSGDVLRNASITNSNNRGVTIHGTSNLLIEGVVLHDVHGHGFFFEDAVETGNTLVGNIALGIHEVGGQDRSGDKTGLTDPFVVDTHDSFSEARSRFQGSAAFWITNPTNTFVGNVSAGTSGTGFWYVLPRTVLGDAANDPDYDDIIPIFAAFGQFDNNTSHSTPVGLNFDRGEDIEDANPTGELRTTATANRYSPRTDASDPNSSTQHFINGFTNYKASGAALYHRGDSETLFFNDIKVADSYNAAWSVGETEYTDSLFIGHSSGNADFEVQVGGPRLYDGAGLYTNTHFAGFGGENAFAFQVEGSSFGPSMYHSFRGTSFENDGTIDNISHAVSDFQRDSADGHDLNSPQHWSKAVVDLDGTLTSVFGGGVGYSIVPDIDFLVDGDDVQLPGGGAWLTDDIYTRLRIESETYDFANETGDSIVRFTARDGEFVDVLSGQSSGALSWVQTAAKTEADGYVDGTFAVEFMRDGIPDEAFRLHLRNADGNRPDLNPAYAQQVDDSRIVVEIVGAGNHIPSSFRGVTEVFTEDALRSATDGMTYYRNDSGSLLINMDIASGRYPIDLTPGAALQTPFAATTIEHGTTIQAEHFDNGPNGIAYQDSDAVNTVGSFRSDTGVDVASDGASGGSSFVGDIVDGEWLEYTADIVAGAYRVGVDVSSTQAGGQVRVLASTSNSAGLLQELGTVDVPDTGGQFSTQWLEGIDLAFAAGPDSVVRLEFLDGGFEVDSLQFAAPTQTTFVDRTIAVGGVSTRIELEEYDNGGQGVSYFDTDPGNNASDTFRPNEDVDASNNLVTNSIRDGEWLEYTTDIQGGVYNITLRKAWGGENDSVRLLIGDENSTADFTELGVFNPTIGSAEELVLENVDLTAWPGEDRVIRVEIVGDFMGLDWLEFTPAAQISSISTETFGVWSRGADPRFSPASEDFDFLKGITIGPKWSDLQDEPPVDGDKGYDFTVLDDAIIQAAANGQVITLKINVGPQAPDWIYNHGVPVVTTDHAKFKEHPYYLSDAYKELYFDMIDEFANFVNTHEHRDIITFIFPQNGATGDEVAYKGNLSPESLALGYDISDEEWTDFRKESWLHWQSAFTDDTGREMTFLFNDLAFGSEEWNFVLETFGTNFGIKNSNAYARGTHLTGEQNWVDTYQQFLVDPEGLGLFNRAEMDQSWSYEGQVFQQNQDLGFYWAAIGGLNSGLSVWDITTSALEEAAKPENESIRDSFRFFNKYADQVDPASSTKAFIALHEGLDAADTEKFSEEDYGIANRQNTERYEKIVDDYVDRGALISDKDALTKGQVAQRSSQLDYNDVGWEVWSTNYSRFIEQVDADAESVGLFRVGVEDGDYQGTESEYSRFARSFDNNSDRNQMNFQLNEDFFQSDAGTVKLSVTYYDLNEGSTWDLRYDAGEGNFKTAASVVGEGSGEWKTIEVIVHDAVMQHNGPEGADFALVNTDANPNITDGSVDDIFHMIEIEQLPAGDDGSSGDDGTGDGDTGGDNTGGDDTGSGDNGGDESGAAQAAFVDRTIATGTTTRIELEEYDTGGQNVAYFDTTPGNKGNDSRQDEDVDATEDMVSGNVRTGEWLEFTTDIEAGTFDITLRKAWSAEDGTGSIKLSIAEDNSSTEFTELGEFNFTMGEDELLTLEDVDLSSWSGLGRVLRVEILGDFMGLDWMDLIHVA